jgi:hypothetical protein
MIRATMKRGRLIGALVVLALPAAAQDYSDGRIRLVEGRTTLQRGSEPGAEEAFQNLPFVPGDRVWTDDAARIEFQFGPQVVRLDQRSKLDYMEHEGRGAGMVTLRLWSGAVFVRSRDARSAPDIAIETPGGLVEARGNTALRIDLVNGEARLSVYEGQASIDNGERRVKLAAGEQTLARRGEDPERPEPLEPQDADTFARWNEDRDREAAWASEDHYLPEEVAPYAPDLAHNGTWHVDAQFGYVWQPYVAAGWRPYTYGRWVWSPYGWTWSPNEAWGWAPSHYGRWSFSTGLGWYWIPGRVWTPAAVTWSVGGDYVGWCPQGFEHGYAVPRLGTAWNYTRRAELGTQDVARRRVTVPEADVQALRVVEHGYHVDRTVHAAAGDRAVPRVQVRPTAGDTIYELRSDPATTIPFPTPRHHYASEDERREREGSGQSRTGGFGGSASRATQQDDQRRRDANAEVHTQDEGRRPGGAAATPAPAGSQERAVERTPDREVMRRVFGPLSGAKSREREADGSADGPHARPSATPSKDGGASRATESRAHEDTKKHEDAAKSGDSARRKNDR